MSRTSGAAPPVTGPLRNGARSGRRVTGSGGRPTLPAPGHGAAHPSAVGGRPAPGVPAGHGRASGAGADRGARREAVGVWRAGGGRSLMATAIAEPPHLAADLKVLRLSTVASQWQPPAEQTVRQRQTPANYLEQLVHLEVTARRERRIQDARFPMLKTLDAFSFEAPPGPRPRRRPAHHGRQLQVGGREAEPGAGIRQEGRASMMLTPRCRAHQHDRVLAAVKARRFAPPPLRRADGLDAGCAHGPGRPCPTARGRSAERGPKSDGVDGNLGWSLSRGHGDPFQLPFPASRLK